MTDKQPSFLQQTWQNFVTLVFPPCCLACSEALLSAEEFICTPCRFDLPANKHLWHQDSPLRQKFGTRVPLVYALAYWSFVKKGKVQQILHHLKYTHNPSIGEVIGRWFGQELYENGFQDKFDLILPIPLHPSKLKKRGYNQSDVLAKGLSQTLQVPYSTDSIIRTTATATQTKKNRLERLQNVANIFEVAQKENIAGKRILVVDDVITTGATLESCLITLLENQCQEVSIATIANTG